MGTQSDRRGSKGARALLLALLLLSFASEVSADDHLVAIVNQENRVEEMTLQQLRLLYGLYRRSWDGGIRVVLILPEEGSPGLRFLSDDVLRQHQHSDVASYYRTATFQQRIVVLPQSVDDSIATALVASERGAIALVDAESFVPVPGVRVLEIRPK